MTCLKRCQFVRAIENERALSIRASCETQVGRPAELAASVLANREVFRCYMDDLYGTTSEGFLAKEHFEAYREAIEDLAPVFSGRPTVR